MLDLFQLLSSPDVNWWTGVLWIIVMFSPDSHSDGTHSLQSIRCWDIYPNLMKKQTHPDLQWPEGAAHFPPDFIFGWTVLLEKVDRVSKMADLEWTATKRVYYYQPSDILISTKTVEINGECHIYIYMSYNWTRAFSILNELYLLLALLSIHLE